ncbi:carbohydrate binding family 9 domain-containing protein [bacterium]|nr:carbohydrate binding family 9 domain-containing protein [bacterium]
MKKFILIFIVVLCTGQVFSKQARPDSVEEMQPLFIPHVEAPIRVDGVMDEPFWKDALVVPANIEVRPGENIEAPVITEAYLVYNTNSIYAGFKCYDTDPSEIRAHLCDRDQTWDDDWILILFDTFNDQQRTYDFACNPFGIQSDIIESPTGGSGSWDAIWESHGRITDEGYVVEMCIPFRALGFQRTDEAQIWGFDVVRSLPRNIRHHIGSFPRDRNNNCYMCQSLKMIGFAGATPGRNIEFDPTFSTVRTEARENDTSGPFVREPAKTHPGLTAKWGFTPNLTLSSTLNPDFSNIEADVVQLDINTQFALYYPEKRPFFLEGEDFFSMPFSLVHTRTLAEPEYGVKLTGKEGKNSIGFYTVQDRLTNFLFPGVEGSDSESLRKYSQGSVMRYKRDVGESSNIGVVLTDREGDAYHNRLGGVDGNFKFTKKDYIQFQVVSSATLYPDSLAASYGQPDREFQGQAYHLYANHNTRNWDVYQYYRHVDRDFRADQGFMTMAGYTYAETGGSIKWQRDPGSWFTWLSLYSSYDQRYDENKNPLHRALTSRLNYQGPLQISSGIYAERGRDMYEGKTFRSNWANAWFFTRPSGWMATEIWTRFGDRIDYEHARPGTQIQWGSYLEFRLGLRIRAEINHTSDHLNVDGGRLYTANIERLKLVYQFNKQMFLRAIIQYRRYNRNLDLYEDKETDPKSEGVFTQFLYSFKLNPQTVLFLGYSDDYFGDHETSLIQTNRTVFFKIGYAYML